jgi:lipopolysaccharide assembly outer membrane protein LptD (OstA)
MKWNNAEKAHRRHPLPRAISARVFAGFDIWVFVLALGIFSAFVMPLGAQEAKTGQEGELQTITFSADRMESVIAKDKEKTVLIGAAVVNTENMEIKADWIELSGVDYNNVICKGNVIVYDESEGFLLKAEGLEYARDSEIGTATAKVVLEDSKNDVLLKADWVRFDQVQSTVDARIGVHILKEDFAVRAEFALYNRVDESLRLSGSPVAVSGGERVEADSMSGKTDLGSMEFSGRVSGTISTKKKEGASP